MTVVLLVGDDWAEDHHDVEVMDPAGRRLAQARLPEGVAGIERLHGLIGEHLGEDGDPGQVAVGIETDRGPWVAALLAAGYTVYAVNPLQASRFRDRHRVSRAKSDAADAHVLADMVRTDAHQLRRVEPDTALAVGIQPLARAQQTLVWERTRHGQRLRHALREYYPAALEAFAEVTAAEAMELLAAAPTPAAGARLSRARIAGALQRAHRRDPDTKAAAIQAALRAPQLRRAAEVENAYAGVVRAQIAVLLTLDTQIGELREQVEAHFGRHPDAEILLSQPGMGPILGARVLGEFGDAPNRFHNARDRKNYAGTSPITRRSGKSTIVLARRVHNDRLVDALRAQAFSALRASPGARAYYDRQRARGLGHHAALRQLANRLTGILHGCLKTRTRYNETTAWPTHQQDQQPAA